MNSFWSEQSFSPHSSETTNTWCLWVLLLVKAHLKSRNHHQTITWVASCGIHQPKKVSRSLVMYHLTLVDWSYFHLFSARSHLIPTSVPPFPGLLAERLNHPKRWGGGKKMSWVNSDSSVSCWTLSSSVRKMGKNSEETKLYKNDSRLLIPLTADTAFFMIHCLAFSTTVHRCSFWLPPSLPLQLFYSLPVVTIHTHNSNRSAPLPDLLKWQYNSSRGGKNSEQCFVYNL